jgi:uncharacterized membrane protein
MSPGPEITTSESIVVEAPIDYMFAAYANLSRMSEWEPLLESVVYDAATGESDWAMRVPPALKFLARAAGVARPAVTWRAQVVREQAPNLLQWQSLSGIANAGSARFEELDSGGVKMTLRITYPLPGGVGVIVQSGVVQRFVRRSMRRTMFRFASAMRREASERGMD